MSFCRNCGAEINNDVAFCGRCGTPVNATQPVVLMRPKTPGRGFGISSMVLGIIGLVYSVYILISAFEFAETLDGLYYSDDYIVESFIPIILVFSVLSILSLCFTPAAFKRGYKNGVSTSGLVMGAIGLALYVISAIIVLSYI